jgi:hypothetical protein
MKRTEGERELTQRQQQALAVHEAARAAGKALSVYAREQGLEVRPIYDAIVGLRRRGVLAGAVPPSNAKRLSRVARSAFVAIDVTRDSPHARGSENVSCRVLRVDGSVIECVAWPDPAWLAAVLAVRTDAAA